MHVLGLSTATGGMFSPDTSPHVQRETYTQMFVITRFVTAKDETQHTGAMTCGLWGRASRWGRGGTGHHNVPFNIFLDFWSQVNTFKTSNANRWGKEFDLTFKVQKVVSIPAPRLII